jgi:hypothetical protein
VTTGESVITPGVRVAVLMAPFAAALAGCGARSDLLETETLAIGLDAAVHDEAGSPIDSSSRVDVACSVQRARVFVTSALFTPNFGGVSGADAHCLASASAQGLGGRWRAWLSDTTVPASAHVYPAAGGYVLLDGTVVAESFGALLSGTLAHAIDLTELNAPITDGNTEVWTGIDVTGAATSAGFCADDRGDDWSSSDVNAPTPLVGHENASDVTWSAAYLQFCNRTNVRLYCFEVCD